MGRRPTDASEPGLGTQYHAFASPPDAADDRPNGKRINGRYWKVGHDYLDTEIGDVCELIAIRGKSSWCNPRDASECVPRLVFSYERYGHSRSGESQTITIDPNGRESDASERFIERYESDPAGVRGECPW